uniref:PDZ domain-containing protein n=1 Tax=Buteo japonicus TaxID=224669 RepID=A0A8C0HGP9_9AVES
MLPADIRPRLCHITRDKSGFGFSVSGPEGIKGTFQLSVRQGGPAEKAGVPPGSWLLEVNGASVRSYSHAQLTRKVRAPGMAGWGIRGGNIAEHPAFPIQLKQSSSKVTLLVASSAVEEFYRLRGLRITAALADTSWLPFKVRELHMVKGPAGYGFLISPPSLCPAVAGQFLWDVDAGLPAEQAGMKEGDRLLAVNGESIEGLDHQQTVLRIRAHDDQVTLLVIDPAGDEFYQSVSFGDPVGLPGPLATGARQKDLFNLPMGQGWNVVGWVDVCCPQCPHCVPAEPMPGGAEEAAPGVLAAQEHSATSQALPPQHLDPGHVQPIGAPRLAPRRGHGHRTHTPQHHTSQRHLH